MISRRPPPRLPLRSLLATALAVRTRRPPRPRRPRPTAAADDARHARHAMTTRRSSSPACAATPTTCLAACRWSSGAELASAIRPSIGETLAKQPGRQRDQLRPRRLAPDPARPWRRPHPHPHRRHRQPRSVLVERRPCGRDQPAHRRPHRDPARPRGLAVRIVGDRRRRQRHRFAHSAPRSRAPGSMPRACSAMAPPPTSARPTWRSTFRSASGFVAPWRRQLVEERRSAHRRLHPVASRCATRPAPAPTPTIRALADLKGDLPNSAARSAEVAGALAYVKGGLNVGVSVTRHTALLRRPDPLLARPRGRGRGAAARRRADPLRRARRSAARRARSRRSRCAAALRAITMTRSSPTARSAPASSPAAAKFAPSSSRPTASGWGGTSGVQYAAQVGAHRRRGKIPPRRAPEAVRPVHPAKLQGGRLALRRRRADRDVAPHRRRRRRCSAPPPRRRRFTTLSGSLGALYELSPGWSAGLNLAALGARAGDRRTVRQRPARRHAGVRNRRPRPRRRTQPRRRGEPAPHRRPGSRLADRLSSRRFANFIYQSPTGEIEDDLPVYRLSPGHARAIAGSRPRSTRRSGTVGGDRLGHRGAGRCGARDDHRASARRRTSRRCACSAR